MCIKHRYLRKVDGSRHISTQKSPSTAASSCSRHIDKNKAGRLGKWTATKTPGRQAGLVNIPTLTADICAAAPNQNKAGRSGHLTTLTGNIFAAATNLTLITREALHAINKSI